MTIDLTSRERLMEQKKETKILSMKSTKKEMLDAYAVFKQLQEKCENEMKPEIKMEEKKIT